MKAAVSKPAGRLYEFGPFRLDTGERLLLRDGQAVMLTPKAFDTLVVLIEHSGHVLEKDELMRAVWPDTFIEENTLTSNISTLRKALGQNSSNPYIETVPKRGYRFVASVNESLNEGEGWLVHKRTRTRTIIEEQWIAPSPFARLTARLRRHRMALGLSTVAVLAASLILILWIANRSSRARQEQKGQARTIQSTPQSEAYTPYVEGRALWNQRMAAGLYQSIEKFEQAIEKDASFALAYDGLADAYAFDYTHWPQAEGLARKALEIDDRLAEPHATLGFIRIFWEWNWRDAEQEFKQAIKLNPSYATAHQWYALCLAATARLTEAEIEMRRAVELEPLSPVMQADLGQVLYFAHQYDEATAACRKALDLDANFFNAHIYLYQIYLQTQMYDKAMDEYFTLSSLPGAATMNVSEINRKLREAFDTDGIAGFYRARLRHLLTHNADPYEIAQCYARLGERAPALDWLKRAFDQHNFNLVYFLADPTFYALRQEPEVLSIQERMGMVER